ncbi:phage holin family protein [[Clostridium] innocuum]|uniref:phage holin family protein n=1 Tax=Clostridium innocuum TaxID=1522 RepID=UPI000D6A8422|nr:phage holin family protein [[Clostridium] innocuum]MCR0316612.1 phage holin family protein [[Clostridium] innocuum]MCR0371922.1 phage holin family protein [[Clostridium] innocuum]MCR0376011.1 phage holin family protein [[Clostridium] innocuum]MCR0561262.1 phage holin family protein [[Clostridium] innocuum]MCR0604532.1 phage holin family protein [[Clostridium] innocuum]
MIDIIESTIINKHLILFLIFIIANILDWITGWLKSRILKQENSSLGFIGIVKKVGNWLIIFSAFLLSYAFKELGVLLNIDMSIASVLGWFVLLSLTVNEFRSILENLVQCNIKIPTVLISGLKVFDDKINKVYTESDDEKSDN